ncbi:hypothetical protein T02_8421 [Trichinella nativa]|uniref:Uncharacterized protein n=1 Tax=Trichinella nativa TaxID=6335 RepID=A0A0V1LW32_9BILA|nr:hypothetical protein T02_8421 [Trichinella nativa]
MKINNLKHNVAKLLIEDFVVKYSKISSYKFPARCESSDPDDDQINNPWSVHVNISRHDKFYEEANEKN